MIDKNNRKDYLAGILYLCIFLFMLVLNKLSVYIADDFRYLYSFNDFKRIESVPQVILSMRAHRYNMNGRLAAHALVQMFGMAPMWLFDLVNALMFTLQIGLIYKISRGNAPRNNLMLLAVFCGVWLFCPAFGQVNLWQDGACNYLWSGVLASLYLLPYLEEYLNNRPVRSNFGKICFLMLSLVMGAYSETVSAAAIGISVLLVIAMMLHCRRKPRPIYWGGIALAFLGYVSIYTAPAQWREKQAEMTALVLMENFRNAALQYWKLFGVLLVAFAVALVLNLWLRTDSKRTVTALIFLAGSLAANFIMVFANYYTARSALGAFVFLLIGVVILIHSLLAYEKCRPLLTCVFAILFLFTIPSLDAGTCDIVDTHTRIKENEAYISECREMGILDVSVPVFQASTKYSEACGLTYLDTENPKMWPNDAMTIYYGLNSLIGYETE